MAETNTSTSWAYNLVKKSSFKKQTDLKPVETGHIRIKIDCFAVIPLDIFARFHSEDGKVKVI